MKKLNLLFGSLLLAFGVCLTGCGNNENVITICASQTPHAEVLNQSVKEILKEKGYELNVTVLDWTIQNQAVAMGDYDANYFQHKPYLDADDYGKNLFAVCKVHYEPLTIYQGKSSDKDILTGKSFAICNDKSNAIRAFQLLKVKGVLKEIPVNATQDDLTISGTTYQEGEVTVTLVAEELLAASLSDYDYGVLPCNTALTAHMSPSKLVTKEDDPAQIEGKANLLAARKKDYEEDENYKMKIDALADALLSSKVSEFFQDTYQGNITCDHTTQIDLR